MNDTEMILVWGIELIPLTAVLFAFLYGLRKFFKKGIPLCLQSITMAMGCYSLGCLYHIFYVITNKTPAEGFTPEYLGNIGFFLFFITASYGQMDKIVDDGSKALRPSRYIALTAPFAAMILLVPNLLSEGTPFSIKAVYAVIWILGAFSVYFNMKHAIIPDYDFGFIKAIKPYNILAVCLGFSELICLTARNCAGAVLTIISSTIFAVLSIMLIISAGRGVKQWTI